MKDVKSMKHMKGALPWQQASSLHETSVITFRVLHFFMSVMAFMPFMFKLCDKRLVTSNREQQPN